MSFHTMLRLPESEKIYSPTSGLAHLPTMDSCTPVTSCATLSQFCFLCSEYKMMLKVCCKMVL